MTKKWPIKVTFLKPAAHLLDLYIYGHHIGSKEKKMTCHQNPGPDDECGAVTGILIGRGNWSTRRKCAPAPLSPPQIPHDLTWDRSRAAVVRSQLLIAWAMVRPMHRDKSETIIELQPWWAHSSDTERKIVKPRVRSEWCLVPSVIRYFTPSEFPE
jgi:hypothetical protein